jgi:hypothetical protein
MVDSASGDDWDLPPSREPRMTLSMIAFGTAVLPFSVFYSAAATSSMLFENFIDFFHEIYARHS